jgi:hypothetical protein
MKRTSYERPLSLSELPDSHKALQSGRHFIETEEGVVFEIRVTIGTRQLSGTEMMRASVKNLQQGRPPNAINLRKELNEIMILLPGQHRKDINVAEQGYYHHGSVSSRSFREVVERTVSMYLPKSTPAPGM